MSSATSLRVVWEGVPVHVRVQGAKSSPLVLFAHPFPLHGACWEPLLAACAAHGFRAAAVDAPGFGGTPPLGRRLLMDDLAQIFLATLDALAAPRAVLVGCSMGGYAVQAFARLHPRRLAGAALVCTKASPDTALQKQRRETQARQALAQGAEAVTGPLVPDLLAPQSPALPRALDLAEGATAQGVAEALRGMAERPDSLPSLRAWTVPALVVAGDKDAAVSAEEAAAMAQAIPGAALHTVAGAGHYSFLDKPAEVEALVLALLQRCEAAKAWERRALDRSSV